MTHPENEHGQTESPPSKRLKLDETSQSNTSSQTGLLSLCDDLMLEIFSYLKPTDILALSQCCQRLHCVAFDRTLWNSVDFRSNCLVDELQKCVKFFLPSTKFLATKGPWIPPETPNRGELVLKPSTSKSEETAVTFPGYLLEDIVNAAPNLTTLILENHIIDSIDLTWDKLPPKLEHLSLRSCHFIKVNRQTPEALANRSFFFKIDKFLPHLKCLDLSACRWFESHSFLALSKCKQLQELRLADCLLCDFVPYVSLGTRFGFKALTVVDLRRTWVSDREVSCLNKTPTLQELYLESPGGNRGAKMITDMAITAFGGTLDEWREMGYIVVLMPQFQGFIPSRMRVIQMCNYICVTDTSLRHCASCLKGLQRINVKGTSCTQAGVLKFKTQRPDVVIECDYNLEIDPETSSSVNET